jgi:hypothetical protein
MTLIADGNTTVEHNIPVETFYQDVQQFFSRSKVGYTPTLVVTYGGPAADPYWRAHTDVWKQPLLQKHVPETVSGGQQCPPDDGTLKTIMSTMKARVRPPSWRGSAFRFRSARMGKSRASPRIGSFGPSSAAA